MKWTGINRFYMTVLGKTKRNKFCIGDKNCRETWKWMIFFELLQVL
jgi:hypothetical protein